LFDLGGRLALVTGGSRGLGLQIAEALGEAGARLALVARKPAELEQARVHFDARGIAADTFACDLADATAVVGLAQQIAGTLGAVDILVNNAGTSWGAAAEAHPLDAWRKVLEVNLTGVFVLTQEIARCCMIPRRSGRIVNVASIVAAKAPPPEVLCSVAYNASKGALVSFTRSLAAEWGRYGITVNAIAPGYFPTRMSRAVVERGGEAMLRATPLGRFGEEDDLKGAALLLASDAGKYITGQVIAVDGGMSAL
jgi:gluconate 5-dehydrogenase